MHKNTYERICTSTLAFKHYRLLLSDVIANIRLLKINIYHMNNEILKIAKSNDDTQQRIETIKLDIHFAKSDVRQLEKKRKILEKLKMHEQEILVNLNATENRFFICEHEH